MKKSRDCSRRRGSKLELIMEELRASLYAAVIQQSSALTLMYCVDLIVITEGPSI
ncbi:MAG: hypothetical protein WA364_18065 [Candidatus Nitrosopolaris sp.]